MSRLNFKNSTLSFDAISISDVPLIHELRTTRRNNYLSPVGPDIAEQYVYYERYAERYAAEEEVYYKISELSTGELRGFVRVTDLRAKYRVGWESLIVKDDAPPRVAIEVCFSIYFLAFRYLCRSVLGPWLVTNDNAHMMKLHEYMKFVSIVDVSQDGYILIVERKNYMLNECKFLKMGFCNEFSANSG